MRVIKKRRRKGGWCLGEMVFEEVDEVVVCEDLGEGDLGHGHVPQNAQQLDQQVRGVRLARERRDVRDELCEPH